MGDLDDAIREHLELKRRRGADAAEVAREEHEALAPVTRSHRVVVASPAYAEDDEGRDAHEFVVPAAPSIEIRRASPAAGAEDEHSTQEFRVERNGIWLADDDF
jgi:hypothetical protein